VSNHIENLEITNFKSIRHQKIEGCKRINVFIGYPNVGKSAILEAMSILSYLQPDYNESLNKVCRVKSANEIFFNANIKEGSTIKYTNNIEATLSYSDESSIIFVADIYWAGEEKKGGNPWENYKRIDFSNGNTRSHNVHNSQEALKLIRALVNVKKYVFNSTDILNHFKTNGLKLNSPFGENLVDIVQFNKDVRKEVGELFKFYDLKLLIDQATNSIRGLKQLDEETIYTVPFYQMAATLQRLIFHKAAIISNENTVLLFEEPEAHMFPPYIRKFTEDLIFNKQNGNQYFISTHSPFVVDDLLDDARDDLSIFLVGLKKGETIIKRLSDDELSKIHKFHVDLFFNIESYLD